MALGYCNQKFNGKATAMPCAELKQWFPNLYMEPMQIIVKIKAMTPLLTCSLTLAM